MKCVCPMGGNRTCPEDCPLAVWATLSPADRKQQRQAVAERLYRDGYTMQAIATQLGVTKATVHYDLRNCSNIEQLGATKSASNPKGAGRPKGSGTTRRRAITEPAAASMAATLEVDRAALSQTAQHKLDAAIRRYQRELALRFQDHVNEEAKRRLDE